MKKTVLALATVAMTVAMGMTAFAGTWKHDDIGGWWWQNDDGSYPVSSWQWLDGNNDGIAECYYFDARGYMLADTVTPDTYTVNKDGAWTVNGVVQTKVLGTPVGQGSGVQTTVSKGGSPADYGITDAQAKAITDYFTEKQRWGKMGGSRKEIIHNVQIEGFSEAQVRYALDTYDFKGAYLNAYLNDELDADRWRIRFYPRTYGADSVYSMEDAEWIIANIPEERFLEAAYKTYPSPWMHMDEHDFVVNEREFTEAEYEYAKQRNMSEFPWLYE